MRHISILFALAGTAACNFEGEVDPDLECNTTCEDDRETCEGDCDDVAECLDECAQEFDDCSLSCEENQADE
jgi:hypothetical protein